MVKAGSWYIHVPAHMEGMEHRGTMREGLEVAQITPSHVLYVVTCHWRLGVGWASYVSGWVAICLATTLC